MKKNMEFLYMRDSESKLNMPILMPGQYWGEMNNTNIKKNSQYSSWKNFSKVCQKIFDYSIMKKIFPGLIIYIYSLLSWQKDCKVWYTFVRYQNFNFGNIGILQIGPESPEAIHGPNLWSYNPVIKSQ